MTPLKFSRGDLIKCQLVEQNIAVDTFDDKELPSDVHLITYSMDNHKFVDAIRAYTMADIFDVYYDKLDGKGVIHSITSGHGRIKPKLYGKIKSSDSEE